MIVRTTTEERLGVWVRRAAFLAKQWRYKQEVREGMEPAKQWKWKSITLEANSAAVFRWLTGLTKAAAAPKACQE